MAIFINISTDRKEVLKAIFALDKEEFNLREAEPPRGTLKKALSDIEVEVLKQKFDPEREIPILLYVQGDLSEAKIEHIKSIAAGYGIPLHQIKTAFHY